MTPAKLGSLIGGVFGLVFVLVNTGGLPSGVADALRALAVGAFVVVAVFVLRPADPSTTGDAGTLSGFTRSYWIVVAVEVVLIFVGVRVLSGPLDAPEGAVAWVSSVVGAHFFALAGVWRARFFAVLGAAMLLCGLVGLGLTAAGAEEGAINVVGGVIPGALLLAFALWGSRRTA